MLIVLPQKAIWSGNAVTLRVLQDTMILLDAPFVDIISKLHGSIPDVRTFVVLTNKAGMPTTGPRFLCYDDLIEAERPGLHNFAWTPVPETAASGICYTSGTTGKPKVLACVCPALSQSPLLQISLLLSARAVQQGNPTNLICLDLKANTQGYVACQHIWNVQLLAGLLCKCSIP